MSRQVLWNEVWSFTKDISLPEENWEQVTLPHSWNALDQEGRFVFRFQVPKFAERNGKPEHEALLKACQEKLRTIIKL